MRIDHPCFQPLHHPSALTVRTIFPAGLVSCDATRRTRTIALHVPGRERAGDALTRSLHARAEWMVDYPLDDVTFGVARVDPSCESR